ncbi:MAG: phage tail fiber protein [Candidatus Nanopelagicales bacterium]
MSSFSDYLENKVMLHVFGGTAYTAPTTLYLALYTTAPTDTGGGTELSGSGYARQTVAFTVTNDTASNTSAIEFPTATGSWGTIVAVGVFDQLTSGNLLAYGNLTASKTIASGDVFRVPAGDLDITLA